MCQCACCAEPARKGFRPFVFLFNLLLAWVLLVVGGGTLINTGLPVAVEAGQLIHTVTFVDPTIGWAEARGLETLGHGLRLISHGIPVPSMG